MTHDLQDAISFELARRVVVRLRASPGLLDVAHDNVTRWSRQNADAPSLLRCYAEWRNILNRPLDEVCDLLCAETEEARRLRQNSPFAGVLPPAEVWSIKAALRERHAKTAA